MRFDPPLASVYFERGQKSEIRALFYKGVGAARTTDFVATLTFPATCHRSDRGGTFGLETTQRGQ